MLDSIIRFSGGCLVIGRHVRLFKRQIVHQVTRGSQTNQEREPPEDSHVRHHSKYHRGQYSRAKGRMLSNVRRGRPSTGSIPEALPMRPFRKPVPVNTMRGCRRRETS